VNTNSLICVCASRCYLLALIVSLCNRGQPNTENACMHWNNTKSQRKKHRSNFLNWCYYYYYYLHIQEQEIWEDNQQWTKLLKGVSHFLFIMVLAFLREEMNLLDNKTLAKVLFVLHFLLAVLLFPLYMQPEPPAEVALCLGVIPCFVFVYATIAWRASTYMQKEYLFTIWEWTQWRKTMLISIWQIEELATFSCKYFFFFSIVLHASRMSFLFK